MYNNVKVAICDSGIRYNHPAFSGYQINGFSLDYNKDEHVINISNDFEDNFGHGTAIYNIIKSYNQDADITNIKVFDKSLSIEEDDFFECLNYIYLNYDFDIINLSLGLTICRNYKRFEELCNKFLKKGSILISAFDNSGAISYPAAFQSVIGVDTSSQCISKNDFEFVEDSIINLRAKGGLQRVAWTNPDYFVIGGNSFASAYVTGYASKLLSDGCDKNDVLQRFKSYSNRIYTGKKNNSHNIKKNFKIYKAAVFPFNKEMHSLIRYSDLLDFILVDVYDTKYSSLIGANVSKIVNGINSNLIIKNVSGIDWDAFDTLIIGHTDQLSNLINAKELKSNLISNSIKRNKNIFSFDPINDDTEITNVYYPQININDLPINRFGKLYKISKPILGVFGTSSKQGKFTLQLYLRRMFMKNGYKVGQIGTEPSALLYGMDKVYPSGYNSNIKLQREENVIVLNNMLHEIEMTDCDIILLGSQSSSITFTTNNVNYFPLINIEFLQATQPDAILLCINYHDDIDYIKRTINVLKGLSDCEIIGLVMFPLKLKDDWSGITGAKENITDSEFELTKIRLEKMLNLNVFRLGNEKDMKDIFTKCIEFFT